MRDSVLIPKEEILEDTITRLNEHLEQLKAPGRVVEATWETDGIKLTVSDEGKK